MSENIYNKNLLIKALQSEDEIIAMWGAYQLLTEYEADIRGVLGLFIDSPFPEIKEAGIAKIGDLKANEYATQLLNLFRHSDDIVKQAAAIAMCNFPNDLSSTLMQKWFEELIASEGATRGDLEAATYSFFFLSPEKNTEKLLDVINSVESDPIKSLTLFKILLPLFDREKDFERLMAQYFKLRNFHSDTELVLQFTRLAGQDELINWFEDQICNGGNLAKIYRQAYQALSQTISLDVQHFWSELENSVVYDETRQNISVKDINKISTALIQWVNNLPISIRKNSLSEKLFWILKGFQKSDQLFDKTVPRMKEIEGIFLLSIPILILTEQLLENWLENPYKYTKAIGRFYHSSLLCKVYREKILNYFFPTLPQIDQERRSRVNREIDSSYTKNEIIWKFYLGKLNWSDVAWPSLFPTPGISAHLNDLLAECYFEHFNYFVAEKDYLSVDYALQLFQGAKTIRRKKIIELICQNYNYLYQHHQDTLYQTVEFIPHPDLIPVLLEKYHEEAIEIYNLIVFICRIFDLEYPKQIIKEKSQDIDIIKSRRSNRERVRLTCPDCNDSFHYYIDQLYVNEEILKKNNRLTPDSVWVPEVFYCKSCQKELPFELNNSELEEYAIQSRVEALLSNSPQNNKNHLGRKVRLLTFPSFNGDAYNPGDFKELVDSYESQVDQDPLVLKDLWDEESRVYEELEDWKELTNVLKKLKLHNRGNIEYTARLGLAYFKLNSLIEAHTCFEETIKMSEMIELNQNEEYYLGKVEKLLKQIDIKQIRKSRFKVIDGKQ